MKTNKNPGSRREASIRRLETRLSMIMRSPQPPMVKKQETFAKPVPIGWF